MQETDIKGIYPFTIITAIMALISIWLVVELGYEPWLAALAVLGGTGLVVLVVSVLTLLLASQDRGLFWRAFVDTVRQDLAIFRSLWRAIRKVR